MANPNRPTHPGGLTALNLRVLRDIEARMPEGGDRYDGAPVIPQPALSRRERYHARRLSLRGRLRRVETDAPWFARRTVLYGSVPEPSVPEPLAHDPRSVVREPVRGLRQPEVHVGRTATRCSPASRSTPPGSSASGRSRSRRATRSARLRTPRRSSRSTSPTATGRSSSSLFSTPRPPSSVCM